MMLSGHKTNRIINLALNNRNFWCNRVCLFQKADYRSYRKGLIYNYARNPKMVNTGNRQKFCKNIVLTHLRDNSVCKGTHSNNLPIPKTRLESNWGKHVSPTTTDSIELQHDFWEREIDIYNEPKSTLRKFYDKVAHELGSSTYILNKPCFKSSDDNRWQCTYTVQWPTQRSFIANGFSKRETSAKAATSALEWLQNRKCVVLNSYNQSRLYSTSNANPNVEEVEENQLNPKSILHNCFASVGVELNKKDLKLEPQYKLVKQDKKAAWMCTYNLKWPEPLKFSMTATTKQEASTKAAEAALFWLHQNKKITASGRPLIYDKKDIIQVTKNRYPCLGINSVTKERLDSIVDVYEKHFVSQLVKDCPDVGDEVCNDVEEQEEMWPDSSSYSGRLRKMQSVDFYEAKEPVELPISKYRHDIIEKLNKSRVLIIKGEPGCGKSTRVPQYVLEAWAKSNEVDKPCRIIVTQPRRIAAISLAERVADEREENVGSVVGYHVRLNSNFNKQTGRIMYCTTGILLRRLQTDPKLSDCSHVILDEAHERDVNIDLLMNLLKHAITLNPNLKLLVMSATLDTNIFQEYFNDASALHVPGFTHPVEKRFLDDKSNNVDLAKTHQMCRGEHPNVVFEDVARIIEFIHRKRPMGAILCFLPGWDEITKVKNLLPDRSDMVVLCLHSKLQISDQRKIFARPPPGVRKVILSTNIAETSVTINDVVYVVDTGIHKEERFNADKGVSCIDNYWISQASAIQRCGRAGRCQAGECFHLYPENKFNQFSEYSVPEILRTSLTKIVLDSKVYSNNMNAEEFLQQLICPPEKSAIENAVDELKELELLDENENLTPLGRKISDFQLSPKLSKAMVNAVIFKCVTPVVDIATLFSADSSLFAKSLVDKDGIKEIKRKFSNTSDHIAMMNLYEKWLDHAGSNNISAAYAFCEQSGMVHHKLVTINKLHEIHTNYLRDGLNRALPISDDFSDNNELVKSVILSGVGTVLQHRNWDISKERLKKTHVFLTRHNQKATITSESVNSRKGHFPSDFLLYINETVSNLRHTTLVRETSIISALAVLLFKTGQLEIEDLKEANFSDKILSDDQVLLKLKGSKIAFVCDRRQAESISKCKEALNGGVQYYVYQLTKGKDFNQDLNEHWQKILNLLNNVLVDHEV